MTARTNQRIDGARLWDTLMEIAKIGATPKGGVRRLTLSEEDRQGRLLFQSWCEALGLKVRVDTMGNMFARREGRDSTRPPGPHPTMPELIQRWVTDGFDQPESPAYDPRRGVISCRT